MGKGDEEFGEVGKKLSDMKCLAHDKCINQFLLLFHAAELS